MDLQSISWNLRKQDYLESSKNTLCILSTGLNNINRQDLIFLAYEFILSLEFKKDQAKWIKKPNLTAIRDLQCVEILISYFDGEKDPNIRMFTFDLLFGDLYNNNSIKTIIKILLGCAVSLESTNTLDCFSKWILNNIGNEVIQSIFDQLITDHLLLMNDFKFLENLPSKSSLFCSLFTTLLLDMLQNSSNTKLIRKSLNLFSIWFKKYPLLAIQALKDNYTNSCSYMLNPFPGILYLNIVYPLINEQSNDNQGTTDYDQLHLTTIRLLQELSNTRIDFKILSLNNVEYLLRKIEEKNLKNQKTNFEACANRFSQVLQIFLAKNLVAFKKDDVIPLINNYNSQAEHGLQFLTNF